MCPGRMAKKKCPHGFIVSSFNFVSPISGVLVSMALLGDQLTVGIIFGVVFVGTGLYLAAVR